MHIGFLACFHAISLERSRHVIFLALVALKLLVSLISRLVACSARIVADRRTHVCAPRVNNGIVIDESEVNFLLLYYNYSIYISHSECVESSGQMEWKLQSVVDNTQLGSLERIVEKMKLARKEAEGERDRVMAGKQQAERERDRAMSGKQQAEGERDRAIAGIEQVEGEKQQVEEERDRALERAQLAETRANDLQRRLDEVEGREHERLVVQEQAIAAEQRGPSWEVKEEDLQATGDVIGIGGWAEVKVAHLKVAAKYLHRQLVHDYHHRLFRREMDVAARVSHPNLLRFLGAKLQGGMAILTELMPTSLRIEVNRGHRNPDDRFSREHIISIATDVACALNYLHHMTPDPIIHRDLSSANVLLQPTPNGGWLAKVSDYGSANFQRQLRTENPGSPVYAAPESHNPALQSPKMDIYSFGVLLVEMCTCQFPVPERRAELIDTIEQPQLVELIGQCLNAERERRPTAAQLVDLLHSMQ